MSYCIISLLAVYARQCSYRGEGNDHYDSIIKDGEDPIYLIVSLT